MIQLKPALFSVTTIVFIAFTLYHFGLGIIGSQITTDDSQVTSVTIPNLQPEKLNNQNTSTQFITDDGSLSLLLPNNWTSTQAIVAQEQQNQIESWKLTNLNLTSDSSIEILVSEKTDELLIDCQTQTTLPCQTVRINDQTYTRITINNQSGFDIITLITNTQTKSYVISGQIKTNSPSELEQLESIFETIKINPQDSN